jgi:hypothetical protein
MTVVSIRTKSLLSGHVAKASCAACPPGWPIPYGCPNILPGGARCGARVHATRPRTVDLSLLEWCQRCGWKGRMASHPRTAKNRARLAWKMVVLLSTAVLGSLA